MTDVKTTLISLRNTIAEICKVPVYVLDSNPAAIDPKVIYIVAPGPGDVYTRHMIGSSSWVNFPIHIYSVVHVKDVNRQKDIVENVFTAYNAVDNILDKVHNRAKNWRKIADMNVYKYHHGITSWTVNTKVYTAYEIVFYVKGILDD